jgi:UDP-2-acetamido-3-amino-2,3-dideoxy-glucuronate N-acetyltransferase
MTDTAPTHPRLPNAVVHSSADVAAHVRIGGGSYVWNRAQLREGVVVGEECIIGKDVYIDSNVQIGARVKIQNGAQVFHGATIEDGVFIGPQACLTNDKQPRAINVDGSLKRADDWVVSPILVKYGASVGAAAVLLPGVTVGRFAMVGAGAVVTRNVPDYGLVLGNPARLVGYVCACGHRIALENGVGHCANCGSTIVLPHLERETI